jgi:hypothetical protein
MATKGKEVHALEKKVRIMAETLCELGKINSVSRAHFARAVGIDYQVLKTAWRNGRLSADLNEKLAVSAGFDVSNPTWIDENVEPAIRSSSDSPSYPGRDSTTAFRAMLRRCHDLPGTGTFIRIANGRPQLVDSNLASFCIDDSGQGAALGDSIPLFFSIIVDRGYHSKGLVYDFRRMRLRLVFDEHSHARVKDRLGESNRVEINGAHLESRGGDHHAEWFLHVPDAILEGEYSTREHPLCLLTTPEINEIFRAEIAVRPMDGTLVGVNGNALIDAQKKSIIEILYAKKLEGVSDSQGWISLGSQRLRIVRADRI